MSKRVYELTVIFPVETKEEKAKKLVGSIIDKAGGSLSEFDYWGEKELAYPIKKNKRAVYAHMEIEIKAAKVKDLERRIGLEEKIMRSLLTIKE